MRLKEDDFSWKSRGIKRRDYRHDPGLPETEIPRGKKRPPKPRSKKVKVSHRHVWVQVSRKEYYLTRADQFSRWSWQRHFNFAYAIDKSSEWEQDYTYYLCAECLQGQTKVDKAQRRIRYRRLYRKRRKERALGKS